MTRVLILDNDEPFVNDLHTQLLQLGCAVEVVLDGNAGLSAAHRETPDVILLSVELPPVNGFSICNKIKKDAKLRNVPLMILSSQSTPETFEQHRKLPSRAQDYIHKPIAAYELVARVGLLVPLGAGADEEDGIVDEETAQVLLDDVIIVDEASSVFEDETADTVNQRKDLSATVRSALSPFAARKAPLKLDITPPPPGEVVENTDLDDAPPPPTLQRGHAPVARELPSLLGDDDDEQTQVGSRSMLEAAASQNPLDITGPPDVSLPAAPPSAPMATSSSPGSSWDPGVSGEFDDMQAQLAHMKVALDKSQAELAQQIQANTQHRHTLIELETIKRQLTAASNASAALQQEILEVRETLQQRDRDTLDLREQLASRDRELLEIRGGELEADRVAADLNATIASLRSDLDAARATIDALHADKALSEKRAEDFKTGAKKISEQLNQRAQQLRDLRTEHKAALAEQQREHDEALAQAETAAKSALSAATKAHREALEELKQAHDAKLAALAEQLGRDASEKEDSLRTALAETETRAEARMAELESKLVEAEAQRNADVQAHADEIQRLTNDHAAQIAQLGEEHASTLEALKAEHARALEALQQQHASRQGEQSGALDAQKKAHGAELAKLKKQHQNQLAELEKENSAAHQKVAGEFQSKLKEKDEEATRQLNAARGQSEKLSADLERSTKTASELGQRVSQLEGEASTLEEQLAEAQADAKAQIDELNERAAADREQLEEAMAELERQAVQEQEEILKELEELKAARQQLDEACKAAEARVSELENLVENQQSALGHAKDQLGGVGGKVAELEKQLDALSKEKKKVDKTLEAANRHNEQLAAKLAGAEKALADSEAKASKLESRSESEKKALAKAHAALGALMDQLGPLNDE